MTTLGVPVNGHTQVSISYSTTAAENRSARASMGSPVNCSGDI